MILEWNDSFNLGNAKIDAQHHQFLYLINKLDTSFQRNDGHHITDRIFEELYRYAQFHFISEENIMQDIGYPGYERHKNIHEELLGVLKTYYQEYRTDQLDKQEFIQFVLNWFVVHTTNDDKDIFEFQAANAHDD